MEKEIILTAIRNNCFHILNKAACQIYLNELLKDKIITLDEGKFYLTGKEDDSMSLEEFITEYRELFSHKRSGLTGRMGDKTAITKKAKRFKLETRLSYREMLELTEYYIDNYRQISYYLVNANYFFYKQDVKRQEHSWAKSILEKWEQDRKDEEIFEINE